MIEVKNLSKTFKKAIRGNGFFGMLKTFFSRKYDSVEAVKNVSFTIQDGEIVGYIGANGAGKSTTIKMMCGILYPTSGEVLFDGVDIAKNRKGILKELGVVFGQKTQLWWDIPLIETFKILKEIYEISDEDYQERFNWLCDLLELRPFLDQTVRSLSLGQRMRADFAASLLHNPKVLFLDEPTIGLDVLVKEKIRHAIFELNQKYKTTVILTTHDMTDIEELCSRVIVIDEGAIIYDGSIKKIKEKFGNIRTIEVPVSLSAGIAGLDTKNALIAYEYRDGKLIVKFNEDKITTKEVITYIMDRFDIQDMSIQSISIEDVAKELYKK